ncbi:hypothetical protein BC829DRAFT_416536 [Chytridium lagenaria]|nr:hypothetical protein BC829DRAFT_416536 [Chytridium lagenaria]
MAEVAFAVAVAASVFLTRFTSGAGGGRSRSRNEGTIIRSWVGGVGSRMIGTTLRLEVGCHTHGLAKTTLNGGDFGSNKAGIGTRHVPTQNVKKSNDFQLERKEGIVRKTEIVAGTKSFPGIDLGRRETTAFNTNLADLVEVVEQGFATGRPSGGAKVVAGKHSSFVAEESPGGDINGDVLWKGQKRKEGKN